MSVMKHIALPMCIAVFVLAVFWRGIFPPSTSRIFLNERRAVQSIRAINDAERVYAVQYGGGNFACRLSDLGERRSEPIHEGLVDRVLVSGTKSSYRFEIQCAENHNQSAPRYTVTAVPLIPGSTGKYALCSDETRIIWYSENGSAAECLSMHKVIEQKYE